MHKLERFPPRLLTYAAKVFAKKQKTIPREKAIKEAFKVGFKKAQAMHSLEAECLKREINELRDSVDNRGRMLAQTLLERNYYISEAENLEKQLEEMKVEK